MFYLMMENEESDNSQCSPLLKLGIGGGEDKMTWTTNLDPHVDSINAGPT